MASEPLISVIIAAFNAEKYVAATIRSVLNQSYKNLEVIIIDDGSTDATGELLRLISAMDPRVRLMRLGLNSGRPAVPRNHGIDVAQGEFVAFLDADDLWTKWKLEDQVRFMLARPEVVLAYSMVRTFGNIPVLAVENGLKPLPFNAALTRRSLESANTIACSSVLTRRDSLTSVNGFDEDPELRGVEDYDLWLRLSERGPLGFMPIIHGFYRIHPAGIGRDCKDQERRVRYLFDKRGIPFSSSPKIRSLPRKLARLMVHRITLAYVQSYEVVHRYVAGKTPFMQLHIR